MHGAGAAAHALKYEGAVWGQGVGHYGNSFAIPTKDFAIRTLSLITIKVCVGQFIEYATNHPELQFMVTQVGCGLAGFKPEQIAPMFYNAPKNCFFDRAWHDYLPHDAYFWN